jgi:TAT (twin-arginine translocation) pathway signal sequence
MKFSRRQYLKSAAALGATAFVGNSFAQKLSVEGFLAGNLRYDFYRNENRASDYNWGEWKKIVPVGTPVKVSPAVDVVNFGPDSGRSIPLRHTWSFFVPDMQINLKNDSHRSMPDADFLKRFVTSVDPRPQLATFSADIQEVIKQGRVTAGMTKEQVMMSLGPPPVPENPKPSSLAMTYYWGSFDALQLIFDSSGKLFEINGLPFVLADLLYVPRK